MSTVRLLAFPLAAREAPRQRPGGHGALITLADALGKGRLGAALLPVPAGCAAFTRFPAGKYWLAPPPNTHSAVCFREYRNFDTF